MIIDAHVHIHRDKYKFGEDMNASVDYLLESMKKSEINKCVILSIKGFNKNEYISKIINKHPDKFLGFGGIDPTKNEKQLRKQISKLLDMGFKGIKLHPRIQGISIKNKEADKLFKVNEINFGLPILIDLFPYSGGGYSDYTIIDNLPFYYDKIANKYPNIDFILAHFGGHKLWDAFSVAKSNENIFLDLSFILNYYKNTSILKDLKEIIKKLSSKKIIYGSDSPEMDLNNYYLKTKAFLKEIGLTEEELKDIFGGNILEILELNTNAR